MGAHSAAGVRCVIIIIFVFNRCDPTVTRDLVLADLQAPGSSAHGVFDVFFFLYTPFGRLVSPNQFEIFYRQKDTYSERRSNTTFGLRTRDDPIKNCTDLRRPLQFFRDFVRTTSLLSAINTRNVQINDNFMFHATYFI